ncbi:heterokaryon incompatibility protein-domain-containing protein, partial [Pyrenochaeta sp. MPI-SDFR-AT-0127]
MVAHYADEGAFIYSPLNYKANAIRLVKLLPRSRPSDPVQCKLFVEKLHPGIEFHALSYVWGPRSHNKILIDGSSLEVRDNLYHFLEEKSLDRDFCLNKRFWVDQICIDQANLKERNHQVSQMAQIYSSARRVHIWLGRGRGTSDGVMDDIQTYKSPYALPHALLYPPPPDHEYSMSMGLQCFAYLSEARYWNRLWIIQEILLA